MSGNRRDFIRFVVAGAVAAGCPIDMSLLAAPADTVPSVEGEDNKICHQVRDGKVFSLPPASAKYDVVIVGGGMSGLAAAYKLQDRDFVLLEKEPHWGGNATLAEYQGSTYGTGAAFLDGTEDEGYMLAREIGLEPLPVDNWDGTIVQGEFVADTWGDGLDQLPYKPSMKTLFKRFRDNMLALDLEKREEEFWNTPWSNYMRGYPIEIRQWWDTYGPSNWGAQSADTAAFIGLYELRQIAAKDRKDERFTFPGGLGAISKRLAETLESKHKDRMLTGATIVAVENGKSDARVTYVQGGELKTVSAKVVIMATPKFITRRLVQGLPQKQSDAMQEMRYIPYAVVNLIYDKPVFNLGYDTWCPGNRFTDVIVADWVIKKQAGYQQKFNILSCYTPMLEEERAQLLKEEGARKIASQVLTDFQKLMPTTNVDPVEVHIYRRGHPLYMSTPGIYGKVQPVVREPFERILFANTDSEGPVSGTGPAIAAAKRAVEQASKMMAGASAAPILRSGARMPA
jgi:oxygen-dependent protoporphyrinogen oxidase